MSFKSKLLEKLNSKQLQKLNLTCFNLSEPILYDHRKIFKRDKATSTFYNTNDFLTHDFPKHVSLIIPKNEHSKL